MSLKGYSGDPVTLPHIAVQPPASAAAAGTNSSVGVGPQCLTKTSKSSELIRTLSDSDIRSPRRRTHSNQSQCKRSRAQTRNHIDFASTRSHSVGYGHGPRPSPVGMSSDAVEDYSTPADTQESSTNDSLSFSQSLDYGNEDETSRQRTEMEIRRQQAFKRLHSELERAHQELRKRDEECKKLSRVRDDLDSEVEELTASLFEEANKMVIEAKTKQAAAEMQSKEANMKLEGLQAEVNALKLLVITSTPSNPGKKTHHRASSADQICMDCQTYHCDNDNHTQNSWEIIESSEEKEVDRLMYREFLSWLEHHCPLVDHPFLTKLEKEDVIPCLTFSNQELADDILKAIKENTLIVEAVAGTSKSRRCGLTKASSTCSFRIQLFDNGKWHFISNGSRSRIVAVANLYTNLRYIRQGLIRKEANAMYWDLVRKRGHVALSRLGLDNT